MQFLMNLVLVVQVLSALSIIGLVLLQQGKGADMGAAFGSGASGTLFGATGSANALSRATAVSAAVFFVCTLALAHFASRPAESAGQSGLLEGRPAAAAAAPGSAPASASVSGTTAIPGAAGAQPADSVAPKP